MWNHIRIDRLRLIGSMKACFGAVKYQMGAKPRLHGMPLDDFTRADCSGFVRWLVHRASYGKTTLPMGSWYQRRWCQGHDLKLTDYAHCGLGDNRLRIAFFNPRPGRSGHVWLVINGQTIECYGRHGVGRREWDTPVLADNVDFCFVLTEMLQ